VTSPPDEGSVLPYNGTSWSYNGTVYEGYEEAITALEIDSKKYAMYRSLNDVKPKHTRWVFTYANTPAPFPSPVKLPLSFQ
jgi:hypothetical protein